MEENECKWARSDEDKRARLIGGMPLIEGDMKHIIYLYIEIHRELEI